MSTNMEKLFLQIFERKRWIVEQVKQQTDLYDQHLVSKCLLEGVAPPPWLWSPSFPSQTSELNKEEIISGLLFPHSRPSVICPSSSRFSYQQPVVLADNVKTLEVTSALNQPLDKRLLEEESQHLSCSNLEDVGRASNSAHEQDPNVVSSRDFQKERIPESAPTCWGQNSSSPFPQYSQDERVKKSAAAASCTQDLGVTSLGYSQGERVTKSVSTSGCKQDSRITSPGYCRDEIAPDSCPDPDPTLSLARIQRSKSRQRAFELRSGVKALKSGSNSKHDLQASPSGNLGFEIVSLRSENVNEIKLLKHNENDEERCRAEDTKNSNSQVEKRDQDINFSATAKSRSPCQKRSLIRKSSSVDKYASVAPESGSPNSLVETGLMNETTLSQPINTAGECFAKEEEKAGDPLSKGCSETVYLDRVTRSKNLTPEFSSKNEHSNFSNPCSVEHLSRSSNGSPRSGHKIELTQPTSRNNKASTVKEARMSGSQSQKVYSGRITRSRSSAQRCRSKIEHSGYVDSSSVKLRSGRSIALQSEDQQPIAVNAEGLLVEEDNTGDKKGKEKGESVDTGRLLRSRSQGQAGFSRDEPAEVGEPDLQENCGVPGGLFEHSTSNVSCGVKAGQPRSSWTKVETSQYHGRITRSRSSSRQQELAKECKASSVSSELNLVAESLGVKAGDSPSSPLSDLPVFVKPNPHDFDNKGEHSFDDMAMNRQEECILVRGSPRFHTGSKAGESELPEANIGLLVNDISIVGLDALTNSLKKKDSLFVPNSLSDDSANLQTPGELSLFDMLKEPLASCISNVNADKESKVSSSEDIGQLDVLEKGKSASTKNSQDRMITCDMDLSAVERNHFGNFCLRSIEPAIEKSSAALGKRLSDDSLPQKLACPQHRVETSSGKSFPPNNRNSACRESGDFDVPERSIQAFCSSSSIMEGWQLQNKRRRTLDKPSYKMPASASLMGDVLDADLVKKKLGTAERTMECHSLDNYDVELQKMIGSASSTQLHLEKGYLFKEAGVKSPTAVIFKSEQLSRESSQIIPHHGVGSGNTDFMPCAGGNSHLLGSGAVRDSVGSPHVRPLSLIGPDDESLPVLEGFIVQTVDENQSDSRDQLGLDSLQLPKTTVERASILEQICRSACMNTPSLHLPTTFNFDGKQGLNQSVPNGLLEGMLLSSSLPTKDDESKKLDGNSLLGNLGIEHAFHGRSHSDCLPFSGAGSSADARNLCASPTGKLWYRSMPKSVSSEKRGSSSPDLPCIDEENENTDEAAEKLLYRNMPKSAGSEKHGSSSPDLPCIDEENENMDKAAEKLLYRNMPKSAGSEKHGSSSPDLPCIDEENENMDKAAEKLLHRNMPNSAGSAKCGSSSPDLPCIDEENENIDEAAGAVCEGSYSKMKNASAERKPLAVVNENMKFSASVSEAKMPVDRQSLESVNTAFSFTATCNSVKSKLGKQNGDKRRCTGKGKENRGVSQGANGARKNIDPLKNRFSKPKLSENSSLTTQGLRLSEKEPRQNNIVSNITSFIPLVQPKPAPAPITGKRDVKVKALEAAEAAKRLAEKKENERKMKKEALKLERARQEQANLRKQELEKKKKEEERKKKEEEMAERKRQREEDEKKLKEAKRKRIAEAHRQQRELEAKLHAEKEEKELKTRAMDLRTKAQKEFKDQPGNAEKTMQEQANHRMPEVGSKTSGASKSNASEDSRATNTRGDDPKATSDPGKVSEEDTFPTITTEESYDISPYKCSDDEDEDEDDDVPNTKFVPAWASKNCVLLAVSSQQNIDPEKIFPPKSFCSIGEVLMPRKLQLRKETK